MNDRPVDADTPSSPEPPTPLRITRRFDAPPARIFDAFVEPAMAREWLFTSPNTDLDAREVAIDLRPGGAWRMTNPMPDQEIVGVGEYLEIDRPRRLAFTFSIPQFGPGEDRIVVELEPGDGGTVLTLSQELLPAEHHDATRQGWAQMFERLDALLASHPGGESS